MWITHMRRSHSKLLYDLVIFELLELFDNESISIDKVSTKVESWVKTKEEISKTKDSFFIK